jgi:dimethylargininase
MTEDRNSRQGWNDGMDEARALLALTREVSPSLPRCELTHRPRETIDLDRARAQHGAYEDVLRAIGCEVRRLPPAPDLPDAVFVEDIAVVFDEVAIVTRPGAASRRAEVRSVADTLASYRPLRVIEAPATLDGGDVLVVGRSLFVGLSTRTNEEGVRQLAAAVAPHGYTVRSLAVRSCLHLKSAVTRVGPATVLLNPSWVDAAAFDALETIEVHPGEAWGANALAVGPAVVYPDAFPRTRERLSRRGLDLRVLDVSELAKAEGGVTCCSLVLEATP